MGNNRPDRVVLITGAAGGIGHATAELFHQSDWRVIGTDLLPMRTPTIVHNFFQADIANPENILQVFDYVREITERLDALVNNAAVQICKPFQDITTEEWDWIQAVNVRAVHQAAKYALPFMQDHGGSFVNVASVHSLATSANISAYTASKGAVLALTRALAIELAPHIRVNAVLPGAINTAMLREGLARDVHDDPKAKLRCLEDRIVMGRIGQPREIAEAILFLADDSRSSYITGQGLVVDGGALARLSTE